MQLAGEMQMEALAFDGKTATVKVLEVANRLRFKYGTTLLPIADDVEFCGGGLDARHMITRLGMANRVSSLTTISTPHRGTYLADWFLANYRRRVPLLLGLEAVGINVDGFRDCQPSVCRAFNATTPDMPGVQYFSYAGVVPHGKVAPMLRRAWALLSQVEGANDGLVSAMSAPWGEFLGTIHADHFAQTPDGLFVHEGESFDSIGFFTRVVEDLARRGL
jgi:triacylglycerol lipase